jgi:hypothetical protein
MTISLKHTFASAKTDSADATLVQPSNWNQEHVLTAAAGKVLGRDTSGAGAVQELPISVTSAGNVTIPNNFAVTGTTGLTGTTTLVDLTSTGTASLTNLGVTGTTTLTNALTVPNGGTGVATLAANNVLLGNGTSAVTTVAPGTSGNVLRSNGTTWTSAAPPVSGSLDAIATGSLSNGSTVVINTDGTVSIVAPVVTPVPSAGASVQVNSGNSAGMSAAYDSVNQKVVVAFADTSGPFGRAVVGTVSGNAITFGSVGTFASLISVSATSCVYDPNTQKIVVAYKDDTNGAGAAAVGTVSGTSITFGTSTNFFGGIVGATMRAVYDALAQRTVIAFIDGTSGLGRSAVGAVSGTSITFGSVNTFSGAGSANEVSAVYDANAQKVVIAYGAGSGWAVVGTTNPASVTFGTPVAFIAGGVNGTSIGYDATALKVVIAYEAPATSFGTAVVGTVSGTSISFGTPVVFQSSAIDNASTVYDASVQKVVISYNGTSNFGTAILGTVSGTSISFSTTVVFQSLAISLTSSASAYNTAAQRTVTAYRLTSGGSARAVVTSATTSTPNLTAENFIGFSSAAYTNGQTATIQLVGSVNTAQSGLTPAESYYVQTDGTLGLTAGSPSVFAGTAVAATKIIVKG